MCQPDGRYKLQNKLSGYNQSDCYAIYAVRKFSKRASEKFEIIEKEFFKEIGNEL